MAADKIHQCILRLLGIDPDADEEVTEEEIRLMVDTGVRRAPSTPMKRDTQYL